MILKKSKSSVLIVTLFFLLVIALLTQQLIKSVMIGSVFDRTMVARGQAQSLAIGGVNLAIAQLTFKTEEEKNEEHKAAKRKLTEEEKNKEYKKWLKFLISNLNRFQTFELKDELDGIDGKIKICIMCENGKINLNHAFDFEKSRFKKEYDFLLKGLEIKGKMKPGEIYEKVTEYLKERGRKLDDISELFAIEDFFKLDIFYEPPFPPLPGKKSFSNTRIALQDLFTIWTADYKMQPLLFSDSMCAVLGVRRPHADDVEKMEEQFKKVTENFKKDLGKNWVENWKVLLPIYEKQPKFLKSINDLLSQEFEANVYSVLSCGIVNKVEQRLLAILKEETVVTKVQDKNKSSGKFAKDKSSNEDKKKKEKAFSIVKIYWL